MNPDKLFTLAEPMRLIPQIELYMERMQRVSMKVGKKLRP